MKSGIYIISNLISKRKYIGSSVKLKSRLSVHLSSLRGGYHQNDRLQKAFNKYGERAFVFGVVEYCEPKNLLEREQFYIDEIGFENLYNILPMAGRQMGYKHTEEFKLARRMFRHTEEAKIKIGSTWKGVKRGAFSQEHIEKLKQSHLGQPGYHKGKKMSEETKRKISESKKGQLPWNAGKTLHYNVWNKGTKGLTKANSGSFKPKQKILTIKFTPS